MEELSELDEFLSRPQAPPGPPAEARRLGMVVGGSLSKGLSVKLDRAAVVFQVVLTKADKPKAGALERTVADVAEGLARHPAAFPELRVTAAETGRGIAELRATVAGLLLPQDG